MVSRARRCADHHRSLLESLESRVLLSAAVHTLATAVHAPQAYHTFVLSHPQRGRVAKPNSATPPAGSLTPVKVRTAYGVDQINFGNVVGTGAGQTIAIIDAYDYPTAYNDLQTFSSTFNLPGLEAWSAGGNTGPWFRRVAQDGSTNYPPTDPAGPGNSWAIESSLDIEWAHAMAPEANIILVEATDNGFDNLVQSAANWARNAPGVSVVSMSFGSTEFSSQNQFDSYFTTPAGHQGVTFFASTGDDGQPGGYPAYSPNVVGVGGTSLFLNGNNYSSESGWNGSGGGISLYESKPAYQSAVTQSATKRTSPDVSMVADPATGVAVYDSWDFSAANGWFNVGGTSLATPLWAGLMAVTDQLRAANGLGTMDGASQTLPRLYQLPASDFHDVTSGSNGFAAGPGYDLVTGRGSPVADLLIPALASVGNASGTVYEDRNGNATFDGADVALPGVTLFADGNNNGIRDLGANLVAASSDVPKSIPDNNTTGATSDLTISGFATTVSDINLTFNITHTFDADLTAYLIAPDGTQLTLFSGIGGSANNFTNTTLDDQAASSIASASAPFTGAFQPVGALATFNGKDPNGTWKLKVVDNARRDTGTLDSWSLNITTAPEAAVTTDNNGQYTFNNLTFGGSYTIRQVVPTGYIPLAPAANAGYPVNITSNITGLSFADFPTIFNATASNSFYARLDSSHTRLEIDAGNSPLATPTYSIALTSIPSLTFNLNGNANTLTFDFANGSPIPASSITVNGTAGANDELIIKGAAPSQSFDMTDTQVNLTSTTPAINYTGISSMSLYNNTIHYNGTFSTLDTLTIGAACTFIFG
jgi:subtilisin-like proprotein convertase family protein